VYSISTPGKLEKFAWPTSPMLCQLSSLNTDLRFARPKIRWWEAQNEGLMKIMSKRSTAHFAFCNN
jgi:hypothetical protein